MTDTTQAPDQAAALRDECFEVSVTDKVGHIRLARPDALNTMTPAFWRDLPLHIQRLDASGAVRAIVVSSTGKHFSAGMDLAVFAGNLGDVPEAAGAEAGRRHARTMQTARVLQASISALEQARVPVIAAVQGGVIGGALDLVTACDLRYASAEAFFCVQEINIGMTADVGTLQRLGTVMPQGVARELAFTGARMPAQRAYDVGLVQAVLPDHDAVVAHALEVAADIATRSPLAMWGSKVAMTWARDHGVPSGLEQVAMWQSGMFQPDDLREGMMARLEGRSPVYDDLLPTPDGL